LRYYIGRTTSTLSYVGEINSRKTDTVINALIKQFRKLPAEPCKSLMSSKLTYHKSFTLATDINVYFCDPLIIDSIGRIRIQIRLSHKDSGLIRFQYVSFIKRYWSL